MSNKIIDLHQKLLQAHIETIRPREEIRDQLDIGFSYDGTNVELFEIRPNWMNESEIMHYSFAKVRFIKSRKIWKLYWMRASGKWELYSPMSESTSLQPLLDCIDTDALGCFKG